MTMTPTNLFVYGTLQFAAIAAAVAGRTLAGTPATLDDYARFAVRDQPFPGIAPHRGGRVEGLLYTGVDTLARHRIDAFEGSLYRRVTVTVRRRPDTAPITAEAYVVRPRWRRCLMAEAWDAAAFARDWHDEYVATLRGYRPSNTPP